MSIPVGILLFVLAFNWFRILRARNHRRAAQARLEIARCVKELEDKMLSGEIIIGDVCHDKMFKRMLEIQSAKELGVKWRLWSKPSPDDLAIKELVQKEVSSETALGDLLRRYSLATLSQFRYQRPVISSVFLIWMLIIQFSFATVLGGIVAMLMATLSVLHLAKIISQSCGWAFSWALDSWNAFYTQVQQAYLLTYLRTSVR